MALLTNLNALESAGLIRLAQLEPDLEYLFRHALVQDAAYASLLEADRQQLHQAVGEAIEQLYGDRLQENAALLARHFERAGDEARALHYFRLAARSALAAYANQEAEQHARRGLALATEASIRAELLAGLGAALNGLSRFDEALQAWREGIDLYRMLGNREEMARLYALAARTAWLSGNTQACLALSEEGLAQLADAPESPAQAQLIHEVARACHFSGQPARARIFCEQALALAERLNVIAVQADALVTWSILTNQPPDVSLAALEKAINLTESAGLLSVGIRAHHNMGIVGSNAAGDMVGARRHFARAVELARILGSVRQELFSLVNLASIDLKMGGLTAAAPLLPDIERLAASIPDREAVQFELMAFRIDLLNSQDRLDDALALAQRMYAEAQQRGDLQIVLAGLFGIVENALERDRRGQAVNWEATEAALNEMEMLDARGFGRKQTICNLRSRIASRQGRLVEARRFLESAQAYDTQFYWEPTELLHTRLELARAERNYDVALSTAEEVAAIWGQAGIRRSWARSLIYWAQILQERGRPEDLKRAQALLRESLAALEEMGMSAYATSIEARLNSVRAALFDQAVAHERASRELVVAGRVQESLLPSATPTLLGWSLAASLQPARETSGDFYDFINLPDGRLGLVVADVADKGAGAALYMAVSRTYLRAAFRTEGTSPSRIVTLANELIVTETHSDLFVTVFCAILDPATGQLVYANAGHNPPLILQADGALTPLARTGMALGVLRDTTWDEKTTTLAPGEKLVVYTDGVTDAQNRQGDLFGEEHLSQALSALVDATASALLARLNTAIADFVGETPQFDDMTLLVVGRLD